MSKETFTIQMIHKPTGRHGLCHTFTDRKEWYDMFIHLTVHLYGIQSGLINALKHIPKSDISIDKDIMKETIGDIEVIAKKNSESKSQRHNPKEIGFSGAVL